MTDATIYRTTLDFAYFAIFLSLCTVVLAAIAWAGRASGLALGRLFAVLSVALIGLGWYDFFSTPRAIVHHPDDTLEFPAPLRTRRVPIERLSKVEVVGAYTGITFVRFHHSQGTISAYNWFPHLHRLLSVIEAKNQYVVFRGC